MAPLFEKMRPDKLADVVGQKAAVNRLVALGPRGYGGRGYTFAGPSGTGKTTLAYIVAREVAGELGTLELDAGSITPKDVIEWRRSCASRVLGCHPNGRALIVNEAHAMRKDTVKALLGILDGANRIPDFAIVVFTTTTAGQLEMFEDCADAHPLMSRTIVVPMTQSLRDVEVEFAIRLRDVAKAEHLDGRPLDEYVTLIRRCKGNARMALNEIEAGAMLPTMPCR